MDNNTILTNAKTLLELDDDESKDGILNLYISRCISYTQNYLNIDEIPKGLQDVIEEMVVFNYMQKGVENINLEGKGSLQESYVTKYPDNIMNALNPHKRVVVL